MTASNQTDNEAVYDDYALKKTMPEGTQYVTYDIVPQTYTV